MSDHYDADYFLRGKQTGKSLYEDYRWMPDLTIPMVQRMIGYCGIQKDHTVFDFGCARGYTVRAFRELGHVAYGYDVSRWAIENADESVKQYLTHEPDTLQTMRYDWIIAKDVLEHIEYVDRVIKNLLDMARVGVFAVVPLSAFDGTDYVIAEYERDVTHIQRKTLVSWYTLFNLEPSWQIQLAYRVPGIKDNYYKPGWETGNGFILARRVMK